MVVLALGTEISVLTRKTGCFGGFLQEIKSRAVEWKKNRQTVREAATLSDFQHKALKNKGESVTERLLSIRFERAIQRADLGKITALLQIADG